MTLAGLDLYGVRIVACPGLEPEFFVIDDWAAPANKHHPEWHSVFAFGESLVAHPSVIQKLGSDWQSLHQSKGDS